MDELLKIPDNVLLKYSRREVGELKSYIEELEYKLKRLEDDNPEKFKGSETHKNLVAQVKNLELCTKKLMEANWKLTYELTQLKNKLWKE